MKSNQPGFEKFSEILGWLQILLSSLLIGLALGTIFYLLIDGLAGLIIGILLAVAGLLIGIKWANNKWKDKGTGHFVSRIMATPELDKPED